MRQKTQTASSEGGNIMLHSKQDILDAINAYVEVLEHDKKVETQKTVKIVLRNVICSLKQIVDDFKD